MFPTRLAFGFYYALVDAEYCDMKMNRLIYLRVIVYLYLLVQQILKYKAK